MTCAHKSSESTGRRPGGGSVDKNERETVVLFNRTQNKSVFSKSFHQTFQNILSNSSPMF